MSNPILERAAIARRIDQRGVDTVGADVGEFTDCHYPGEPRWRLSARWVEFECGCVAERCRELVNPQRYDPIIFANLPEQAVYEKVCHFHGPGMQVARMGFGGFKSFEQWKVYRRARLMGRVR
jgi:hypothetical protein